jgi:hypothetical protein
MVPPGCIASAVIVDKASLLSYVDVTTPTYKTIIACFNKAEIEALTCPTQKVSPNFHGCVPFLSAPWFLEAVLDTNTSGPALLILAASEATAEFDHNFNNDPDYVTGAKDQLKEFALWAWCTLTGRIPAQLIYSVEPNNEALRIYSKQRHYSMRTTIPPRVTFQAPPPQGNPPDIFNLLNAYITCQANAMELLHTKHADTLVFHKEKETKKKDQFHKFHPLAKQLILFASASDINNVPTKPEDTCECFMNATTQGIMEQEVSMQFRVIGLDNMAYATRLTLNLYSGKFLYAMQNNLSNFSCFFIHEGTHLDKEEQQDS